MDPHRLGCALAAASAILLALKGVLIKDALNAGADPTALLWVRMAASLPCLAVVAWWCGRGAPPLPWRARLAAAACGLVGFHLAGFLDVHGIQHISVALERVILYLFPTMVVALNWALGRARPAPALWTAVAITWLGVAVSCIGQPLTRGSVPLGILLVAGAAAAYAAYFVGIEPLIRRHGALRTAALAMGAACLGVVVHGALAVPAGVWLRQPAAVWRDGLLLAGLCTVLPALLGGGALGRIGGGPSAVIASIGPGVTVLAAWAWLGERPTPWIALGLALSVVGAIVAGSAGARRPAAPAWPSAQGDAEQRASGLGSATGVGPATDGGALLDRPQTACGTPA
ncbi:MAG: DMT family transporter [Planctomycetes bacterium]|nr:DMT family transporter [Planctomycetota bacterium]